jgi:hypothetical protein
MIGPVSVFSKVKNFYSSLKSALADRSHRSLLAP